MRCTNQISFHGESFLRTAEAAPLRNWLQGGRDGRGTASVRNAAGQGILCVPSRAGVCRTGKSTCTMPVCDNGLCRLPSRPWTTLPHWRLSALGYVGLMLPLSTVLLFTGSPALGREQITMTNVRSHFPRSFTSGRWPRRSLRPCSSSGRRSGWAVRTAGTWHSWSYVTQRQCPTSEKT